MRHVPPNERKGMSGENGSSPLMAMLLSPLDTCALCSHPNELSCKAQWDQCSLCSDGNVSRRRPYHEAVAGREFVDALLVHLPTKVLVVSQAISWNHLLKVPPFPKRERESDDTSNTIPSSSSFDSSYNFSD